MPTPPPPSDAAAAPPYIQHERERPAPPATAPSHPAMPRPPPPAFSTLPPSSYYAPPAPTTAVRKPRSVIFNDIGPDSDNESVLPPYAPSTKTRGGRPGGNSGSRAGGKYGPYATQAEYLAALREWVEERSYVEPPPKSALKGFYGSKTLEDYAADDRPRWWTKKAARPNDDLERAEMTTAGPSVATIVATSRRRATVAEVPTASLQGVIVAGGEAQQPQQQQQRERNEGEQPQPQPQQRRSSTARLTQWLGWRRTQLTSTATTSAAGIVTLREDHFPAVPRQDPPESATTPATRTGDSVAAEAELVPAS